MYQNFFEKLSHNMKELKQNVKDINSKLPENILQNKFVKKATDQAKSFSQHDLKYILDKMESVQSYTNSEIDKWSIAAIDKLLEGIPENEVTPEVKHEIIVLLKDKEAGRLKYIKEMFKMHMPKDIESVKKIRLSVAKQLIHDASLQLSKKEIVEAQILDGNKAS
jgi:hypothetical protein